MIRTVETARRPLAFLGCALSTILTSAVVVTPVAQAITLEFDYRYDTIGFFGAAEAPTPARKALEWAGRAFESFSDSLAAISPGGANHWTAAFLDPTSGQTTSLVDLSIAADRLVIMVGAYDMPGAQLGVAGPGTGAPAGGSAFQFSDAVTNRGEGNAQFDFAPWGGSIQFDTTTASGQPRAWHFDVETAPGPVEYDFYTVAVHELSHLMGFGTSGAFFSDRDAGAFIGAVTTSLYGGPVPLDGGHWAVGVTSPPFADPQPRPALGPLLAPGARNLLTPLDYAALADIGWNVPSKLLGLPGDVNGDGAVDGSDLLDWQQGLGGAGLLGDASGDGVVDPLDRWMIKHYYGATTAGHGQAAANATAAPEPGCTALAIVGGVCYELMRRSRRPERSVVSRIPQAEPSQPA